MNIIDSSGWLEYFSDGPNAEIFEEVILDKSIKIIVPAIVIYEVFKKILIEKGESIALQIITQLQKYQTEPIDDNISIEAAKISFIHKMPMADSIIYAVTKKYNAVLWTQDEHFKDLDNIKFIEKK